MKDAITLAMMVTAQKPDTAGLKVLFEQVQKDAQRDLLKQVEELRALCAVMWEVLGHMLPEFNFEESFLTRHGKLCKKMVEDVLSTTAGADLLAERDRLRSAAQALVDQIDLVHADPENIAVWIYSDLHRGPYSGPQYNNELNALKQVLQKEP